MKTTIDLNKARYCSFGYVNQEGSITNCVTGWSYTVHGCFFEENEFAYPLDHKYPHETLLERAKRLDILDTWTPIIIITFTKYDTVTVRGEKAVALRDKWNSMIFGKKKQKKT